MSKKMMFLALVAISAALFALPAVAAAQEIHLEPRVATFSITGPGGELRAEATPTVTCDSTAGSGTFDINSTTTGTTTLDLAGCHTSVFGFTAQCHTEGSALNNTIATSTAFHLITWVNAEGKAFPAILLTAATFKIVCAGISTITVTGNVIGTITSPPCGSSSTEVKLSFTATGTTQNHIIYTGSNYDLKAYTGSETANEKTAALVGTMTHKSVTSQKLVCT